MADVIRRMLDNGELNDETCRSILIGLGKDVDELHISPPKKELGGCSWSSSSDEEEEVDPRYSRQVKESQGFDIDNNVRIPAWGISPCNLGKRKLAPSLISLYGRLGVHCFNFHKGRNLKFLRIPKYNSVIWSFCFSYFITVDVEDLADNSLHIFQTQVTACIPKNRADFNVRTDVCRLKPDTPEPFPRDDEKPVDKYYNCSMPKCLVHVPRADRLRFYEVQEQDILENDWLFLYADFSLYNFRQSAKDDEFLSGLPEKINKVIVETFETHSEPCLKLKSSNAIFHISFSATGRDYKSVVRRTTNATSGNMMLEINSWRIKPSNLNKNKKGVCV